MKTAHHAETLRKNHPPTGLDLYGAMFFLHRNAGVFRSIVDSDKLLFTGHGTRFGYMFGPSKKAIGKTTVQRLLGAWKRQCRVNRVQQIQTNIFVIREYFISSASAM